MLNQIKVKVNTTNIYPHINVSFTADKRVHSFHLPARFYFNYELCALRMAGLRANAQVQPGVFRKNQTIRFLKENT